MSIENLISTDEYQSVTVVWYMYLTCTYSCCSEMYDRFDPFSVCLYMKKPTNRQYDIQCELYRTLISGGDYKYDRICLYIPI